MDIVFRKACAEDLDALMDIFAGARAFLAQQKLDQWQDGYPERSLISQDIAQGQCYVLTNAKGILATSVLQTGAEADYAVVHRGAWHVDEPYACIHRLALAADKRGSGLASRMLAELEGLCRLLPVLSIRVDTHQDNLPMQRVLVKNGFTYCGAVYLSMNGARRVAYDKVF